MKHLILLLGMVYMMCSAAQAEVYVVYPDTGPTIQEVIDVAQNGDVIELADGTFGGAGNYNLEYNGKAITVRSQGGDAAKCIIDCEPDIGPLPEYYHFIGFIFDSGEGPEAVLQNVTITNGRAFDE